MISHQCVKVFVKYAGDSDAFARIATPEEQALLSSDVIRKIEDIIMHLSLTKSGAASGSYAAQTASLVTPSNIEPSGLVLLAEFVGKGQLLRA
jgi:hypothetical protein